MKKAILTLVMAAGLAVAANAQDVQQDPASANRTHKEIKNMDPSSRARKSADRAEKDLGLNADQKAKWEAAALERSNANAPLRDKMKGSTTPEERSQVRQQMKANDDKFETTVNAFLTSEQKTKYESIKQERKSKMHSKMHEHRGQN
jgi:hypothetical protein